MFQIDDVWEEAKKIFGACDDTKAFRWLSDALTLIANKGDFEGWKGYLDICTSDSTGRCVTLPREVGNIYGVNVGGHPTLGLGQLFNYHLNGPGDCNVSCRWSWQDKGANHSTYTDLSIPAKLVAYTSNVEDNGKKLIVHGYDSSGNRLKRETSEGQQDGWQVPTIYGYAMPDSAAPVISRIEWVEKEITKGPIRLSTIDDSGPTGQLLAVYEPDETMPQYRRIMLSRSCSWVRIAYRYANPIFRSKFDRVPLHSRLGFLLACEARKFYSEKNTAQAHTFEADAARLEIEAQLAMDPVTFTPVQMIVGNNLNDSGEDIR